MGVTSGSSLFTAAYFLRVIVYFKTFWKPCTKPVLFWLIQKPPPQNNSRSERNALNDLSHEENIVILPVDKGKCTLVLNSADYESKCDELLKGRSVYKLVGYNPTKGYRKKVCDFVNNLAEEDVIDSKLKNWIATSFRTYSTRLLWSTKNS